MINAVQFVKLVVYLVVSREPGILPPFPVEVVEVDGAGLVGEGGHRHDPGGRRGLDLVEEEVGEEEVAEVVRPDLHLEAVLRLGESEGAHMTSANVRILDPIPLP